MTTINIKSSPKLSKSDFDDLIELYDYLESYIWADLHFTSYEDLTREQKLDYNNSLNIDKNELLNI